MTIQSFEDFANAELGGLLRFATVLTGQPDTAADAVQSAMVRAHGKWGRIAGFEFPVAYLRRMITNEWLGGRRRWFARNVTVTETDDLTQLAGQVADSSEPHALREDLNGRLSRLPRRQRAALVLRYYLDYDDAEIAAELDCAVGTVRSLCSRGIAALRVDGANL